jgi:RNA recognition motif-containing protein
MPRAGQRSQAEQLGFDERRLSVTNVSAKVTKSQLQAFFNKFGKVPHLIECKE